MARKDDRIPTDQNFVRRFWSKVEIGHPDECWEWKASTGVSRGYGQIGGGKGVTLRAHRVAFVLVNGPQEDNSLICHKCNNRRCCNPKHLYCGTYISNYQDMVLAGNAHELPHKKGVDSPEARFTQDQIIYIINSELSYSKLGSMFGVSKNTIFKIKTRKSYKNTIEAA